MGYDIGYADDQPAIEQGSTFELSFVVTYPADIMENFLVGKTVDGAINCILRAQYTPDLTGVVFTDFAGTVTKLSTTTLGCKLTLTSAQTAALTAGLGRWDCELVELDTDPPTEGFVPYVQKPLGCGNKAKVLAEATKYVAP